MFVICIRVESPRWQVVAILRDIRNRESLDVFCYFRHFSHPRHVLWENLSSAPSRNCDRTFLLLLYRKHTTPKVAIIWGKKCICLWIPYSSWLCVFVISRTEWRQFTIPFSSRHEEDTTECNSNIFLETVFHRRRDCYW